jgi:hypothetical protein
MVFGISTPGPIDKQNGAKQGTIGKKEHAIKNAYVSRLGGSTFVMDDGDDKFVREKKPSEAGPKYIPVEQGKIPKDYTMPHNELVRIRTRSGHQILLHNSEDLIYISHGSGKSWFEMTANGKIDVYAKDSISFHTDADFNFHAGRDINFQADRNVNIKAVNDMQIEAVKNLNIVISGNGNITTTGGFDIKTTGSNKFTAGGSTNIKSGGNHLETAAQIHMNGPGAAAATAAKVLKIHTLPTEDPEKKKTINSIMKRVPTFEPWPHHENLDPITVSTSAIDRDTDGKTEGVNDKMKTPPASWKQYTTITDTFNKVKPPEKKK